MQVAVGSQNMDLEVSQSLQAVRYGRHARGKLAGVGDDRKVASQAVAVLGDVGLEIDAADLFLTLDQELDVHRQRPGRLEPGLCRLQVSEHLALVVRGPASIKVAVADCRLERRREPGLQRFGRLDVIMAVDEQGGFTRGPEPFRINNRMALGGDQLGFQPHRGQIITDEGCRPLGIGIVVRLGADAGNPDQSFELRFEVVPMPLEIRVHLFQRHERPPFRVPDILQVPRSGPSRCPILDPAHGTGFRQRIPPAGEAQTYAAQSRPV